MDCHQVGLTMARYSGRATQYTTVGDSYRFAWLAILWTTSFHFLDNIVAAYHFTEDNMFTIKPAWQNRTNYSQFTTFKNNTTSDFYRSRKSIYKTNLINFLTCKLWLEAISSWICCEDCNTGIIPDNKRDLILRMNVRSTLTIVQHVRCKLTIVRTW